MSEFAPGSPPAAWHFPLRNRIISGLADLVLVVEARKKSGALITVDYALEQGKSVYAVPGRLGDPLSEGCNLLLAQGAAPACSPEQLLEELGDFRSSEGLWQPDPGNGAAGEKSAGALRTASGGSCRAG